MSLDQIFADVTNEMTRALRLQSAGKITRVPSDVDSTNIESVTTLNEEIGEVHDEVIVLLSALIGLEQRSGRATKTVNDLEQMLYRWRLDPPLRIDETDRVAIGHLRERLRTELVQVASVAISFILRLDSEEQKHRSRMSNDASPRSKT